MNLGSFYIALTVKDLQASREFYEKLGFVVFDGKQEDNWLMMRNGETKIGLFHGMFDKNLLTFHPSDVRTIQKSLKAFNVTFKETADESTTGPAYASLEDPDGNPILLDPYTE